MVCNANAYGVHICHKDNLWCVNDNKSFGLPIWPWSQSSMFDILKSACLTSNKRELLLCFSMGGGVFTIDTIIAFGV